MKRTLKVVVALATSAALMLAGASAAAAQNIEDVQIGCPAGGCPGEAAIQGFIGLIGAYGLYGGLASLFMAFGFYAWAKWDSSAGAISRGSKLIVASLGVAAGLGIAAGLYNSIWTAAQAGA